MHAEGGMSDPRSSSAAGAHHPESSSILPSSVIGSSAPSEASGGDSPPLAALPPPVPTPTPATAENHAVDELAAGDESAPPPVAAAELYGSRPLSGDTECSEAASDPGDVSDSERTDLLALVTGGAGFVGRHLIDQLLDIGFRVRSFDSRYAHAITDERVEVIIGDIRDAAAVRNACRGVETVFHCCALTEPNSSYAEMHSVNCDGTAVLVRSALAENVGQLVHLSTTSVVIGGDDIRGGTEATCAIPRQHLDSYSATKAIAERAVIAANGRMTEPSEDGRPARPLVTCALRPHAIFGPRDPHFISKLIECARAGAMTHMIGDGANLVDFTYVGNVVHAAMLAMYRLRDCTANNDAQRAPAGQCYFITNGSPRQFG
jgi:sterol-4alpha-carboxylate 3-dehydrogenase (decarboxylating)